MHMAEKPEGKQFRNQSHRPPEERERRQAGPGKASGPSFGVNVGLNEAQPAAGGLSFPAHEAADLKSCVSTGLPEVLTTQ